MDFLYEPPTNLLLAALLSAVAAGFAWQGTRRLIEGLRQADHPYGALWLVRGIRGWIVALAMGALAGGVFYDKGWPLIIGLIFLGEELYETGVVSLALRAGKKAARKEGLVEQRSSAVQNAIVQTEA